MRPVVAPLKSLFSQVNEVRYMPGRTGNFCSIRGTGTGQWTQPSGNSGTPSPPPPVEIIINLANFIIFMSLAIYGVDIVNSVFTVNR